MLTSILPTSHRRPPKRHLRPSGFTSPRPVPFLKLLSVRCRCPLTSPPSPPLTLNTLLDSPRNNLQCNPPQLIPNSPSSLTPPANSSYRRRRRSSPRSNRMSDRLLPGRRGRDKRAPPPRRVCEIIQPLAPSIQPPLESSFASPLLETLPLLGSLDEGPQRVHRLALPSRTLPSGPSPHRIQTRSLRMDLHPVITAAANDAPPPPSHSRNSAST